jgi:hypothetical protein
MNYNVDVPWAKIAFAILVIAATGTASLAQTAVEIEIAGPWSYVQDPADPARVVVVAPDVGHTMAVFMGDNAFNYSSATLAKPSLGPHRLDFPTLSCGSSNPNPPPSPYPVSGINTQDIQSVLASPSAYSLSLPKPCSYADTLDSRFKFNTTRPVTATDTEASFPTWMTLHYQVAATTVAADLDKGLSGAASVTFGNSGGGSVKKAISVILYLDGVLPDVSCDSHSATAFDATLALWKQSPVFRLFPQLQDLISSNQQLGTYCYTCAQKSGGATTMCPVPGQAGKHNPMSPGRADCHAAQVNVNGVVK